MSFWFLVCCFLCSFFAFDTNYSFRYTTPTTRLHHQRKRPDECGVKDRPGERHKKRPKNVDNVSWAVGEFFFVLLILFFFLVTPFTRTYCLINHDNDIGLDPSDSDGELDPHGAQDADAS